MLELNNTKRISLLVIHFLFGVLFLVPIVAKVLSSVLILYAIVDIVNTKNENYSSITWAFYFVSAEVFFRMTGGLISWELIKYTTFLLLLVGALVDKNTLYMPLSFVLYILLILIGISYTDLPAGVSTRKQVIFNLSGPVLLGLCAITCYKKKIKLQTVYNTFFYGILPIISMVVFLYFRTPSISEIKFGGTANFEASGGFGPNQVATALGFGLFLLGSLIIAGRKVTGFVGFDILIFLYIIFRCLLTFSRGGLFTGIIALIIFAFYFAFSRKDYLKIIIRYLVLSFLFITALWIYTSEMTGGMLENRYTGKNASGVQKKDISSGRFNIISNQFDSFIENPFFGIGVANGKYHRLNSGEHVVGAAHNEAGRILEEHGLIGLLSLALLIFVPLKNLKYQSIISKAFTISFYLIWFLTINHSAMRIALPSFVYGLSLIKITDEE